ncbi:MAG: hypothetical protein JXR37_30625 [Kiritimatiellae bacterium]|nr:hypothetical protein [Kiritimatiellia bacterium]
MRNVTANERKRLWNEVRAEFRDDRVMQEVHFARLVHHEMLRGEPPEICSTFYREQAAKVLGKSR